MLRAASRHQLWAASAAVLVGFAVWGCGGDSSGPATAPSLGIGSTTAPRTQFELCKVGSDATFDVTVGANPPTTVSLTDGQCQVVATNSGTAITVSVSEQSAANTVLDSIVKVTTVGAQNDPTGITTITTITGTNTASGKVGLEWGTILTFYNTFTPPEGGEGCTPGYWKQSQHFDSWPSPYLPTDQFSTYFDNAFPGQTLLQVLSNNGNVTGLDALGRHTVAALLNAASSNVSYDLTPAQVISAFNAVYPGTKAQYIAQKNIFEGFNTQGCPLN